MIPTARLVSIASFLLAAAALAGCSRVPPPIAKTSPPDVVFETPVRKPVTEYEDFTGRTEGYKVVDIRPEVTGRIKTIHFKDGAFVTRGAPLFEIDDVLYAARKDTEDKNVKLAEVQVNSTKELVDSGEEALSKSAISKDEVVQRRANWAVAVANLGVAKAKLKEAETTLNYTKIIAPETGRISRRKVDPGNTVKADETVLTTLVVLDPIYISFDIDERTLLRIRRLVREGAIASARDAQLRVLVGLADEEAHTFSATLTFVDNVLDLNTGTLRLRAEMRNPDLQFGPLPAVVGEAAAIGAEHKGVKLLSPGMFVRVRLPIGKEHPALMIPEEATASDQGQRYVYVLGGADKDEVIRRKVTLGPQDGRLRAVNEYNPAKPDDGGVAPGERVIVSGHQRVRPGIKVTPKPAGGPKTAMEKK